MQVARAFSCWKHSCAGNEEAVALPSTVQNSVLSGIADDQMLCALVRVVGRNHVPTARQWA